MCIYIYIIIIICIYVYRKSFGRKICFQSKYTPMEFGYPEEVANINAVAQLNEWGSTLNRNQNICLTTTRTLGRDRSGCLGDLIQLLLTHTCCMSQVG